MLSEIEAELFKKPDTKNLWHWNKHNEPHCGRYFCILAVVCGMAVLIELVKTNTGQEKYLIQKKYRFKYLKDASSDVPRPKQAPIDAVWQRVAGTTTRFYVFSAYAERRTEPAVRVIGAAKLIGPDPVLCRIWLPDNRTITTNATIKSHGEHHRLKYTSVFVLCSLREFDVMPHETVGASVSVIARAAPLKPPTNHLLVLDTEPQTGIKNKISICVKPLHFTYNRNSWFIEWMEFNRILGVSYFYMYNSTVSGAFSCILDYYIQKGLILMIPWKMPFLSRVEIRTEAQFAAFNDCLYRSMAAAGWLLPIDIDELVLPRNEDQLLDLLNSLDNSTHSVVQRKIVAAHLFRNAFFYVRWDDDPLVQLPALTARKTRRLAYLSPYPIRSKYAVRPMYAIELGNHKVEDFVPRAISKGAPVDRAILHHYRVNCKEDKVGCLNENSVQDRLAVKWSRRLVERIAAVKHDLLTACPAFPY